MKKLLFVINAMNMGGAEKSLISLLSLMDYSRYSVDLLVADPQGILLRQLPSQVNLLSTPADYLCYASTTPALARENGYIARYIAFKLGYKVKQAVSRKGRELSLIERKWLLCGAWIKPLPGEYDTAISYFEGAPNYYVMEKVTAKRKVLWSHSEFDKMQQHPNFQRQFYEKADAVCTISKLCVDNLRRCFPRLEKKFLVLENITSAKMVRSMALETPDDERFAADTGYKIVSVGRLAPAKGMDQAVEAAALMKAQGLRFHWYVAGDGEMREQLTARIAELHLQDTFFLLGTRLNPYAYLARADLVVQPSRFEGRSIAMDEAKLLCRPILATRYATVTDVLEHDVNGYVADMSPEGIAQGAALLMGDKERCARYTETLRRSAHGNEDELKKYEAVFDGTPPTR